MSTNKKEIIKIIGVGGAGCNIINTMCYYLEKMNMPISNLVAMNTDIQSLEMCSTKIKTLQLGENGLGAGSNSDRGREAAMYSNEDILNIIEGHKLVILCAGFGGGTGSGATPAIAKMAKEQNCLVVVIVITPFINEGRARQAIANKALEEVKQYADAYIIISNEGLASIELTGEEKTMKETLQYVDKICIEFISSLVDILYKGGFINIDYSDLATTIHNKGKSLIGIGFARGDNAAREAIKIAIENPLLQVARVSKATNALVHIVGRGIKLSDQRIILDEVNRICGLDALLIPGVRESATDGSEYDDQKIDGKFIKVMIMITGASEDNNNDMNIINHHNTLNLHNNINKDNISKSINETKKVSIDLDF